MSVLMSPEEIMLCELEHVIEQGLQTFYQVGAALMEIRDTGLYKEKGFRTFEDYCQERWGFNDRHARRMIDASDVMSNLESGPIGPDLPTNESQVRPLTTLSPEFQPAAWSKALEIADAEEKPVTAVHVRAAVDMFFGPDDKKQNGSKQPTPLISHSFQGDPIDYAPPVLEMEPPRAASPPKFNRTNDNVEWALWTWNPVTGCKHDCPYCYARDIANRFYPQKFEPTYHEARISAPRHMKVPEAASRNVGEKNVFVCSMADLWGNWVPRAWIEAVLNEVRNAPQWNFLFLTKFPARYEEFAGELPANAWIGTTVDKQWAVQRAEKAFRKVMDAGHKGVRWLSCEPMLERLTFERLDMFDWVVAGGASRSTQTPEFKPPIEWTFHLWQQAKAANCKFYMKTNIGVDLDIRIREYPGMEQVSDAAAN